MKIREVLNTRARNLEVTGTITRMESVALSSRKLVKATLADETGSIILNLWGEQANQCRLGDIVRVKDAYVKTYGGVPELNTWKNIEVLKMRNST
jgi:ssDNA-binding replication factor A large subunit